MPLERHYRAGVPIPEAIPLETDTHRYYDTGREALNVQDDLRFLDLNLPFSWASVWSTGPIGKKARPKWISTGDP